MIVMAPTVYCDGPETTCPYYGEPADDSSIAGTWMNFSRTAIREELANQGWHFTGHKDYCPTCWEARRGNR